MPKQLIIRAANTGIVLDEYGQILTKPSLQQYPDRIYLAHQVKLLQGERTRIAAYLRQRTYSLDELLEITGYCESVVESYKE